MCGSEYTCTLLLNDLLEGVTCSSIAFIRGLSPKFVDKACKINIWQN